VGCVVYGIERWASISACPCGVGVGGGGGRQCHHKLRRAHEGMIESSWCLVWWCWVVPSGHRLIGFVGQGQKDRALLDCWISTLAYDGTHTHTPSHHTMRVHVCVGCL
jgi:hypothetical protein